MCNRIDSTTSLLKAMFLNCGCSCSRAKELCDYKAETKMCNEATILEECNEYFIMQIAFDMEVLQYKFVVEKKPMGGVQQIKDIIFIGFNE